MCKQKIQFGFIFLLLLISLYPARRNQIVFYWAIKLHKGGQPYEAVALITRKYVKAKNQLKC